MKTFINLKSNFRSFYEKEIVKIFVNFIGRRLKLLSSMVELVSRVEKLGPDTGLGTQGGYRFSAVS